MGFLGVLFVLISSELIFLVCVGIFGRSLLVVMGFGSGLGIIDELAFFFLVYYRLDKGVFRSF